MHADYATQTLVTSPSSTSFSNRKERGRGRDRGLLFLRKRKEEESKSVKEAVFTCLSCWEYQVFFLHINSGLIFMSIKHFRQNEQKGTDSIIMHKFSIVTDSYFSDSRLQIFQQWGKKQVTLACALFSNHKFLLQ